MSIPCISSRELPTLSAKLNFLQENEILPTLTDILQNCTVSTGKLGERCVEVPGFRSWVYIDTIVQTFLQSPIIKGNGTLKERLDCDTLWTRIDALYKESDTKVTGIFLAFAQMQDFIASTIWLASRRTIEQNTGRNQIFSFTLEECMKLWPDENLITPKEETTTIYDRVIRPREKVQEAYDQESHSNRSAQE